jgi:DNA-binding CsgD family transcriptional regulator
VILVDLGERPRPSIQTLRQAFGLTGAEAQIAARLAFGESLRRIADDHKVSIVTTRAQLKAVFAKTGTHRQAELVALVNRLAPLP